MSRSEVSKISIRAVERRRAELDSQRALLHRTLRDRNDGRVPGAGFDAASAAQESSVNVQLIRLELRARSENLHVRSVPSQRAVEKVRSQISKRRSTNFGNRRPHGFWTWVGERSAR